MSSKSTAHHPHRDHPIFNRKFMVIAAVLMIGVFFITVTYYPLIFSAEKVPVATEKK